MPFPSIPIQARMAGDERAGKVGEVVWKATCFKPGISQLARGRNETARLQAPQNETGQETLARFCLISYPLGGGRCSLLRELRVKDDLARREVDALHMLAGFLRAVLAVHAAVLPLD